MPKDLNKLNFFGTWLLLLALLVGPALQMRDCFNDPPNHDHDVTLHLVDAVLCVAVSTAIVGTLLLLVAVTRTFFGFVIEEPVLWEGFIEVLSRPREDSYSPPRILRI